jgi:enolase-phosphatase E1
MQTITAKGVLLDIEGTTSSISFVYDVMFPYVRKNLDAFLVQNWDTPALQNCLPTLASDVGKNDVSEWLSGTAQENQRSVAVAVIGMMDDDIKATGLKELQGLIWKSGFHTGQMVAHLFDDVAVNIKTWRAEGLDVRIYSSGSIAAQKLFFGHTIAGNLLDQFSGHYDTTTGSKRDSSSYAKIANEFDLLPSEIVFVSDVVEELAAASEAGMQTVLSIRPGNKSVPENHDFDAVSSFEELKIEDASS